VPDIDPNATHVRCPSRGIDTARLVAITEEPHAAVLPGPNETTI